MQRTRRRWTMLHEGNPAALFPPPESRPSNVVRFSDADTTPELRFEIDLYHDNEYTGGAEV